mgnify:CR=1 FL=1
MAVTISDNYQVKYTRKWGTLLQQHASRLDKYVSVMRDLSGKVVFLDQFGILDFTEKTTRVGQTVLNEAPTTRRSMRPRTLTQDWTFPSARRLKVSRPQQAAAWTT